MEYNLMLKVVQTVCAHCSAILSLKVNPNDSNVVITGGEDGKIILWNTLGGQTKTFAEHTSKIINLSFSATGHHFLSFGSDSKAYLWDSDNEQGPLVTMTHQDLIWGIFGDRKIYSAARTGQVKIWNTVGQDKITTELPDAKLSDPSCLISKIYEAGPNVTLYHSVGTDIFRTNVMNVNQSFEIIYTHDSSITALTVSPDNTLIALGDADGNIKLVDEYSKQMLTGFSFEGEEIKFLGFVHSRYEIWAATPYSVMLICLESHKVICDQPYNDFDEKVLLTSIDWNQQDPRQFFAGFSNGEIIQYKIEPFEPKCLTTKSAMK